MLHPKPRSWAGTCDGCLRDVAEGEPYYTGQKMELYCLPCAVVRDLYPNVNVASAQERIKPDAE